MKNESYPSLSRSFMAWRNAQKLASAVAMSTLALKSAKASDQRDTSAQATSLYSARAASMDDSTATGDEIIVQPSIAGISAENEDAERLESHTLNSAQRRQLAREIAAYRAILPTPASKTDANPAQTPANESETFAAQSVPAYESVFDGVNLTPEEIEAAE